MTERQVKITLVVDEKGAVHAMRTTADESEHAEGKFKHLDKGVKELGKSFGGLKGMVGAGLGAIGGVGALAYGLKSVLSTTSEIAEETHKFSSITGISEQTSLRYTAALKARGIGAEAGGNAFKFLAKNVELAERQEYTYGVAQDKAAAKHKIATGLLGVQATAFKQLGIDVATFGRLSEQGKFDLVIHQFESMKDGIEKTRLETEIFGRGGTALSTVLDKGALGFSHANEMAKRFFPTLKGGSRELEELQEKQAESKMAWEGLEFTLGVKLVPALTEAGRWFSNTVVAAENGKGVWGELERTFEGIAHWTGGALKFVEGIGEKLGVHVGGGTLGAALMALAGDKAARKVAKPVKHFADDTKAAVKFFAGHPYLLPAALPAGAAAAYGYESTTIERCSPGTRRAH